MASYEIIKNGKYSQFFDNEDDAKKVFYDAKERGEDVVLQGTVDFDELMLMVAGKI